MQNVADIYPLTPTQAGMLYHLLREDDPELYLEQFRADVTASVDDDAWAVAWQTLVDRHPALRTIIVWKGLEEPRQVVREHVEIPVEVIDLRDLDAAEQAKVHDDVAASQRRDGLSLTAAPMSRVVVSRIADDRWHLIRGVAVAIITGAAASREGSRRSSSSGVPPARATSPAPPPPTSPASTCPAATSVTSTATSWNDEHPNVFPAT